LARRQPAILSKMSLNTRQVAAVILKGVELRAGDRVKIQPKHDEVFSDAALTGKIGVIEAFEQDAENRVHVALVLEGEPAEAGARRYQPGERFLFTLDEIEPVGR
jgi:hypothetical protein